MSGRLSEVDGRFWRLRNKGDVFGTVKGLSVSLTLLQRVDEFDMCYQMWQIMEPLSTNIFLIAPDYMCLFFHTCISLLHNSLIHKNPQLVSTFRE